MKFERSRVLGVGILGVIVAGAALGQVPPEEAQRRLSEKQSAKQAAEDAKMNRLVSIKAVELEALKAQVAQLKAENTALREALNVAQLKAAAANAPVASDADTRKSIENHRLKLGMTIAEANAAMGSAGEVASESARSKTLMWRYYYPESELPSPDQRPVDGYTQARFESAKLVWIGRN